MRCPIDSIAPTEHLAAMIFERWHFFASCRPPLTNQSRTSAGRQPPPRSETPGFRRKLARFSGARGAQLRKRFQWQRTTLGSDTPVRLRAEQHGPRKVMRRVQLRGSAANADRGRARSSLNLPRRSRETVAAPGPGVTPSGCLWLGCQAPVMSARSTAGVLAE